MLEIRVNKLFATHKSSICNVISEVLSATFNAVMAEQIEFNRLRYKNLSVAVVGT